jgi:predicted ATPase/signal transduction histidine kinase
MISLAGYNFTEKLFESNNTIVYRAYDESRKIPVVVKMLKDEYPKPEAVAGLEREYKLLENLKLEGVIEVFSLQKCNNGLAIIMEDFGASSLSKILEERNLSLKEFLSIGIKLTEILGDIHQLGIIHKDINPSNILWNSETDKLKVIDFEISTVLPREIATTQNPNVIEGTLAYISPERTGRMNRMIDYRTDLYSLGVTLYEMLTGQQPFPSNNAMELIHCHIAKDPIPPYKLNSAVLREEKISIRVLSNIILKLMSKNAEERYQSVYGLKTDLENCLEQLLTSGKVRDFKIAKKDFSNKFQIPQKLYGREKELELLINSFKSSCQGNKEMMIVTGFAGIGKSALVNEIHKSIIARRGFFITGKFEQFKRNIPYFSLIQAFQQLIKQILTESDDQIAAWRIKILEALGPNGQIIIDVIPAVELIIGKQPQVTELPSQESQNRFNLYFRNFISTFTNGGYTLTIFLDDLQWIDLPSLNLIELFMTDSEIKQLFFIGAYRDNEIDSNHPLLIHLRKIEKGGTKVNRISLSNLDFANVNLLLADTLKCSTEKTEELAKLCLKKTDGNPFFLKQFLQIIYEDNIFAFDKKQFIWHWEIGKIEKIKATDNVVNLMVSKIQKLSHSTQSALQLAACVGSQFDLKTLSIVCEKSPAETATNLWEALKEELIFPLNDEYKFIHSEFENIKVSYKFSHDRIQHAVYSLIEEDERKKIHLKTGRLLLSNSKKELEEEIFNITNQLNSGQDLITDKVEREELASLNFLAGQKAKAANAYESADQYYTCAINLLENDCWEFQYSLALKTYTDAAEASFFVGNFERMDDLARQILDNSRSLLDKIRINEIIIQSLLVRARLKEAVARAISILRQLGVHIPENPGRINVLISILRVRLILSRFTLDDLSSLPQMTDEYKLAAMRILKSAASSAYRTQILMCIAMALEMVKLSVRYGNSPFSPYGYCAYGIVLLGIGGKTLQGYDVGRFSIDIISRYKSNECTTKINALFNLFMKHWKDKLKDTIEPLLEVFQLGLETGDFEFGVYGLMYSSVHSLFSGIELEQIGKEIDSQIAVIRKLNQERILSNMKLLKQLILNLTGQAKEPTLLIGESFNEEVMMPSIIDSKDNVWIGALYIYKTIVCYLFGKSPDTLQIALAAEKCKVTLVGLIYLPLINYYTSLVFLSENTRMRWYRRLIYLVKVFLNQRTLKKWATDAPENYLHKWYLVEAEKNRVLRRKMKSLKCYEKAILLAHNNGYIHDEALANELAARYNLAIENSRIAESYMTEARYLYSKWGAKAKVNQIDEEYQFMLAHISRDKVHTRDITKTKLISSTGTTTEQLDLVALQIASQTISSEIHLDKLLEKLLKILITNAGAEKGYIILTDDDKLYLEGEAFADKEKANVLCHIPLPGFNELSHIIINYVLRTKEIVTLDDALKEELFNNDEYIIQKKLKSLFCMPLVYQNKLSGILYLENNLITGAFTSERVEMLKMLCGQIVISVENARLYKDLEEYNRNLEVKVEKRTAEISQKNQQLSIQKEELNSTLENLKHSQVQLVQSEKMASLGQLVAGIAHEINNPVTYISAGVDSLKANLEDVMQVVDVYHRITPVNVKEKLREIDKLMEKVEYKQAMQEINKLIESVQNGTKRTTEIVKGLRTFSRLDEDILKMADIHEGLDSTLILLHNKYKNRIEIVRNYGDLPLVECYPGQLNQVFMNILANSIDAIEGTGTITIKTSSEYKLISISIRDTGKGIDSKQKEKIFEPFYTTKEPGRGTGLGLSISHGIIEKHNGKINFKSEAGQGTEFTITIPAIQE